MPPATSAADAESSKAELPTSSSYGHATKIKLVPPPSLSAQHYSAPVLNCVQDS